MMRFNCDDEPPPPLVRANCSCGSIEISGVMKNPALTSPSGRSMVVKVVDEAPPPGETRLNDNAPSTPNSHSIGAPACASTRDDETHSTATTADSTVERTRM